MRMSVVIGCWNLSPTSWGMNFRAEVLWLVENWAFISSWHILNDFRNGHILKLLLWEWNCLLHRIVRLVCIDHFLANFTVCFYRTCSAHVTKLRIQVSVQSALIYIMLHHSHLSFLLLQVREKFLSIWFDVGIAAVRLDCGLGMLSNRCLVFGHICCISVRTWLLLRRSQSERGGEWLVFVAVWMTMLWVVQEEWVLLGVVELRIIA